MDRINAYKRLTHRYVGTCSDLDQHQWVARIKLTPGRITGRGNSIDEGNTIVRHARAPVGVDLKLLMRAIADTMSRHGCTHEYDCCGCASYTTRVRHLGSRRLLVHTETSYNY